MNSWMLFFLLLASVGLANSQASETNVSVESSTAAVPEEDNGSVTESGHFLRDLLRSSSTLGHIRQELEQLNKYVNDLKSVLDRMESNLKEDMAALQEDIQSLKTTSVELETDVQTSSEAMERMAEWTSGTERRFDALERSVVRACRGARKRHEAGSKSVKMLKKKKQKVGGRVANEEFLLQPQADEGLTVPADSAIPATRTSERESVPVHVKDCSHDIKTEIQKIQKQCVDICKPRPSSCADIQRFGTKISGHYTINPWMAGFDSYATVKCDLKTDGGGWTIIQHRDDYGSPKENFDRNWTDYKSGFGDIRGEFWLGNEIIYALTNQEPMTLRVELESFDNETKFAEYSHFRLGSEEQRYRLHLGSYGGNAADSLGRSREMNFSTRDSDHDNWTGNCARRFKGGWWFNNCHDANLNGFYYDGNHESYADGINWYHWKGFHHSLKRTEMKIRPEWMNDVIKDGG